ncbi:hypothetical protein B0T11DRAFT_320895 [Plectosphaerella cucumerina]|uniref:Uncharacterized protein n=1 Tax=Plectosphaerella cucumerina TaxID=40658 RepID=A0A8K0X036_9PEZI|nr:hypothetical protein B0T11DRAFT_320895 [Plectosphaerella cucumerina]
MTFGWSTLGITGQLAAPLRGIAGVPSIKSGFGLKSSTFDWVPPSNSKGHRDTPAASIQSSTSCAHAAFSTGGREQTDDGSSQKGAKRLLEAETSTQRKKRSKTYSQKPVTSSGTGSHGQAGKDAIKRGISTVTGSRTTEAGSSIATPLLRRARFLHSSPAAPHSSGQAVVQRPELFSGISNPSNHLTTCLTNLAAHRTELGEAEYGIYEGILRDYNAILSSTKATETTGAKSLLVMCLRQIPSCVALIAKKEREGARRVVASSFEVEDPFMRVYDELEGFGHGAGWRHLSTVVRSHALWLLKDVITSGLLGSSMVDILAHCCRCYGYHDDAVSLLEALAARPYPGPQGPKSTFRDHKNLELLSKFADTFDTSRSHRPDSCLVQLILRRRELPAAWLSTRGFQPCWARLIASLAGGHMATNEQQLLQSAIAVLCSSRAWPLSDDSHETSPEDHTLVAVVGAMVSMTLVAAGSFDSPRKSMKNSPRRRRVQRRMLRVLWGALYEARSHDARPHALAMLRLGIFFHIDQPRRQSMDEIMHQSGGARLQPALADRTSELTATLVCSIARCSSRALCRPPQPFYNWLCDQLQAGRIMTHKAIRADAAFMLARETADLRDLVFAEAVRKSTSRPPGAIQNTNSQHTSAFAGYRWEEGISEWVLVSPDTRKRPMAALAPSPAWRHQAKCLPGPQLRGQQRPETVDGLKRRHSAQHLQKETHVRQGLVGEERGLREPSKRAVDSSSWAGGVSKNTMDPKTGLIRSRQTSSRRRATFSILQVAGSGYGSEDELLA